MRSWNSEAIDVGEVSLSFAVCWAFTTPSRMSMKEDISAGFRGTASRTVPIADHEWRTPSRSRLVKPQTSMLLSKRTETAAARQILLNARHERRLANFILEKASRSCS